MITTTELSASPGAVTISSGRCGSTVLSDVLAQHESVLQLVEFFGPQHRAGTAHSSVSGPQFWDLVDAPRRSLSLLLSLGRPPSTLRYPLERLAGRTQLSGLLGFTLPAIFDDPDEVHADLHDEVTQYPQRPLAEQYRALFHSLTVRAGRSMWIEKSAMSGFYAADLVAMFPDAPVIHLCRDIVDVALSMSYHPMFQLADITVEFMKRCGFDPFFNRSADALAAIPPDLAHLLPDALTAETLDARAGSPEGLVRMSAMQGVVAKQTDALLDSLPAGRVLTVTYEDLLADPAGQLHRLGGFLSLADADEWAARAATTVSARPSRRAQVSPQLEARMHAAFEERYAATEAAAA